MIYDFATEEQKRILETMYNVKPFYVKTITMERVFIDKLFAAEAYTRKSADAHRAFEAAKHIYDLAVISEHPKIISLLSTQEQLKKLLDIRITEELNRHDGIPNVLPSDFQFFTEVSTNSNIIKAYDVMQKQYVLRDSDQIEYAAAMKALSKTYQRLRTNPAWRNYKPQ